MPVQAIPNPLFSKPDESAQVPSPGLEELWENELQSGEADRGEELELLSFLRCFDHNRLDAALLEGISFDGRLASRPVLHLLIGFFRRMIFDKQIDFAVFREQTHGRAFLHALERAALVFGSLTLMRHEADHVQHFALDRLRAGFTRLFLPVLVAFFSVDPSREQ